MTDRRKARVGRRFYTKFDGVVQEANPLASKKQFTGRLILDTILGGKVVLTDQQLIDGAWFHALANSRFWDLVPVDGIEVRARHSSFEQSIVETLVNPHTGLFRPLSLQMLPIDQRNCVQSEIIALNEAGRVPKIRTLQDVATFLADVATDPSIADRLSVAWAKMAEMFSRDTVRWTPVSYGDLLGKELRATQAAVSHRLRGKEGAPELMRRVMELADNRNLVQRILRDAIEESATKVAAITIESWYNYHYHHVAAVQHRCLSFETHSSRIAISTQRAEDLFDAALDRLQNVDYETINPKLITLPGGLSEALVDAVEYDARFIARFRQRQRQQLADWYETGDTQPLSSAVRALIVDVDNAVSIPELRDRQRTAKWAVTALTIAGAGTAGYAVSLLCEPKIAAMVGSAASVLVTENFKDGIARSLDPIDRDVRRIMQQVR